MIFCLKNEIIANIFFDKSSGFNPDYALDNLKGKSYSLE